MKDDIPDLPDLGNPSNEWHDFERSVMDLPLVKNKGIKIGNDQNAITLRLNDMLLKAAIGNAILSGKYDYGNNGYLNLNVPIHNGSMDFSAGHNDNGNNFGFRFQKKW